jgi:tetratricopeptide (TPR) repeat protein
MKPTIFDISRLLATVLLAVLVACSADDRAAMDARLQRLCDADARYEQHTSDKEARALAAYYERHGDAAHRARAFYLAGRVCSDLKDAPQALDYFQKSVETVVGKASGREEMLRSADDGLLPLLATTYSQMGSLFFEQQVTDEALDAYRQAYRCDSLLGDTAAMVYDLRDIGNTYRGGEPEDSCLHYFQQALLLAQAIGDDTLAADVQSQLAAYYVWHDQYDRARQLLEPALAIDDEAARSGIYSIAAELCMRTGQLDSAKHYYRALVSEGTIFAKQGAYRGLADIAMKQNQPGEALRCLRLFEEATDSVTAITDGEALRRIHALYNYQLRERENHELRLSNARGRMILIVAICALVLLMALLVAGVQFYRRKRLLFALRLERLERLLEQKSQAVAQVAAPARPDLRGSDVYQRFDRMSQLGSLPADGDWQELEQLVNRAFPDFTQRLFSFCRLSSHEYHVCLLQKLGIPPQSIGFLTAHTRQSISNTRARLYQKAFGQKGRAAQWDEFIDSL